MTIMKDGEVVGGSGGVSEAGRLADGSPLQAVGSGESKLGDRVAREIELKIRDGGWKPGDFLGNEADLLLEFGVSRSVFREAVAIAEWEGLIEARRGREGGFYVSAPADDAATSALRNYLFLIGATLEEIIRARLFLDAYMFYLAMRRMTSEAASSLLTLLDELPDDDDRLRITRLQIYLQTIGDAAGAPPLWVFSKGLRQCYVDRARSSGVNEADFLGMSRRVSELRRRQLEAVIGCDFGQVLRLQFQAQAEWSRFEGVALAGAMSDAEVVAHEMQIGRDSLIYEFIRPVKKSEAVARAIVRRIQREEMAPGDRLGVEPDLLREFGVGRGVFREAVRILERFGITETERGKGGGLCVGRPHLRAVVPVMRRCFDDSGRQEVLKLLAIMGREAARGLARDAGQKGGESGTDFSVLGREVRHSSDAPTDERLARFMRLLCELSGDKVLACLADVLADLVTQGAGETLPADHARDFEARADRVICAIEGGEALLAPRLVVELCAIPE